MPPARPQNPRPPAKAAVAKSVRRRRPVDVRDNFTLAVVRKSRGGEFVSTYAEHQQTGKAEEWAGWQPPKLVSFFEQQTGGPWSPPDPSSNVAVPNTEAPTVSYGPTTVVSTVMNGNSLTTHYHVEMMVTIPIRVGQAAGTTALDHLVEATAPADSAAVAGRSVIAFEQFIAPQAPPEGGDELTARLTLDADKFAMDNDDVVVLVDVFARCGQDPIGTSVGRTESELWAGRPPIEVLCRDVPAQATVYAVVRVESTYPRGSAVTSIPGGTLEVVSPSP
jgi:hypothetical protein